MPLLLAKADGDDGDSTGPPPPVLHTRYASRHARYELCLVHVCSYPICSFFDVDLCLLFRYSMFGKTILANGKRPRIARLSFCIYCGINTSRLSRSW